jgi:hypothetical protein
MADFRATYFLNVPSNTPDLTPVLQNLELDQSHKEGLPGNDPELLKFSFTKVPGHTGLYKTRTVWSSFVTYIAVKNRFEDLIPGVTYTMSQLIRPNLRQRYPARPKS